MSIDFQALGASIGEIRKEWGYTQKDVYQLTKVSIETQRRIEHGLKEPKITTLERLSALYKVDLLKLSLEKRESVSFFSDEMIKIINRIIWQRDLEAKKKDMDRYISLLNYYRDNLDESRQVEGKLIDKLISFSAILRYFEIGDFKYKEQNIHMVEDFLMSLDSSGKRSLQDPYQLNLEITLAIFLVSFFHLSGMAEECLTLLDKLELSINKAKFKDLRNSDYAIVIKLNRVVAYQSIERYEEMYESAKEVLEEKDHFMPPMHIYDAIYLKGIAMYKLGMEGSVNLITTALVCSNEARKRFYIEELKRCSIPVPPPN